MSLLEDSFKSARINVKEGVILTGLRPEVVLAVFAASMIYASYGKPLWITSALDGKHSATSLHYAGQAVDLRTNYFDAETIADIAAELKQSLGRHYDVVAERDHLHIEYQPRYTDKTMN